MNREKSNFEAEENLEGKKLDEPNKHFEPFFLAGRLFVVRSLVIWSI